MAQIREERGARPEVLREIMERFASLEEAILSTALLSSERNVVASDLHYIRNQLIRYYRDHPLGEAPPDIGLLMRMRSIIMEDARRHPEDRVLHVETKRAVEKLISQHIPLREPLPGTEISAREEREVPLPEEIKNRLRNRLVQEGVSSTLADALGEFLYQETMAPGRNALELRVGRGVGEGEMRIIRRALGRVFGETHNVERRGRTFTLAPKEFGPEEPVRVAYEPTAEERRAAVPRRVAVPTITELREQGYSNVVDANIGGKIYRFAARDPSLDLVGMGPEKLLQHALDNPGSIRIFEVDRRGYATRELLSERDIGRLRERIAAQP